MQFFGLNFFHISCEQQDKKGKKKDVNVNNKFIII